jgi:hypothetical protein
MIQYSVMCTAVTDGKVYKNIRTCTLCCLLKTAQWLAFLLVSSTTQQAVLLIQDIYQS